MFLFALHGLCIVAVFVSAIPIWIKALLVAVVATSLACHLKQFTTPQLVWRNANRWFVNDEETPVELSSINFFSRWLVILSLSGAKVKSDRLTDRLINHFGRTRKFIIPFDSLDEETFRLLRVRLRIEGYELLNPPPAKIK